MSIGIIAVEFLVIGVYSQGVFSLKHCLYLNCCFTIASQFDISWHFALSFLWDVIAYFRFQYTCKASENFRDLQELWKKYIVYTCQLSRLRRESHACRLKTSISRQLTLVGQFLTPDWKMWVVAVLLDTISKNMLTQTHCKERKPCVKRIKWQYLPHDLWFCG